MPYQDLTNKQFSDWTVLCVGKPFISKRNQKTRKTKRWLCKCKCGNTANITTTDLKKGKSTSCRTCSAKTHNKSKTPEYSSWLAMKQRCTNPNNVAYAYYKDIKICNEWLNSFDQFLLDMGLKPNKSYTLDRIDNNIGYQPDNCRWASKQTQGFNKKIRKGYTKVKSTGKWRAQISVNSKVMSLGTFNTKEEAHEAYLDAKKKYHKN